MATVFSGLNRFLDSLRSANHDFVPTTEIFAPFDVERVAADMDLAALGAARGKENLPATNTSRMDEVELKILQRVDDAKSTAFNNLEDQLHHFTIRLGSLDFEGQFSMIEKVNSESLTDFKGEVVKGKAELHTLRRNLNVADKDLAAFQKKHKLERGAIAHESSKRFMKWSLLGFFFIVEWLVNGLLLSEGSTLGFVGGAIEAGLFSLLNVFGTVVITMFGIRNLIHRSFFRKFLGLISLIIYIVLAVVLNLVLAHYRELSGNLIDGIGVAAFKSFITDPIGLTDIKSWMLFGAGLFISIGTLIDTLYLGDPYIGYQAVHTRRGDAEEEYKHTQAELIDQILDLRNDHNKNVEEIIVHLKERRREHADIIAHRAKIMNLFKEYQSNLERASNQLISIYRDANIAERTTDAPKHFGQTLKMERMKPTLEKSGELSDKQIAAAIKKAQTELSVQIKEIAKACDDGIAEYRELDNMYPEVSNG